MMAAPTASGTYTTIQVSALAHVSQRQLQWWDEKRILCPAKVEGSGGGGRVRRYTETELDQASRLGQLRKAGVSLQRIRKILKSNVQWETVVRIKKPTLMGSVLVVPCGR